MDYSSSNWGKHHILIWKGLSCHWRVLGDPQNQPLVLIHGFGASSDHWRNNAKFFADKGFCVYGLDLIGFGKSEQPSNKKIKSLDNRFWSDQLINFLEDIVLCHNSYKAVLVGNSLGSLVALTTIVLRPELVKAIIAAPLPDPSLVQQISSVEKKWVKKIKVFVIKAFFYLLPLEIIVPLISRTFLISQALQFAYFRSIKADNELQRLVKEPSQKTSAARALRAMCIGMSLRPKDATATALLRRLSENFVRPPILMIWGREDKLIPLFSAESLIKQHPWIKLLVIDKCGHCPHDESPKYFNESILNWLEIHLKSSSKKV